jgi:hypothetical protein
MFRSPILTILAVLAVTMLACGVTVDLPVTDVKTGPTVTDSITIPSLDGDQTVADLNLAFGAGSIKLNPGAEGALVQGTALYNVVDFKPEVTIEGNNIRLEQGNLNIRGIPNFSDDIINEWDLKIGQDPIDLTINAGAYKGRYELGGLAITELQISDGAAEVEVSFSQPNRVEMSRFEYNTGASDVSLTGLSNANIDELTFRSGAGSYILDFSGDLRRSMDVNIESGVSSLSIIIPTGRNARVIFDGGLSNISISGDWEKSGSIYLLEGSGPEIEIRIKVAAGNLELKNR